MMMFVMMSIVEGGLYDELYDECYDVNVWASCMMNVYWLYDELYDECYDVRLL